MRGEAGSREAGRGPRSGGRWARQEGSAGLAWLWWVWTHYKRFFGIEGPKKGHDGGRGLALEGEGA